MNKFRIFQPAKNAMQSGKKNTKKWLMLPIEGNIRSINPLTGSTSVSNTSSQLKYEFATKEDAINFATKSKFKFEVEEPHVAIIKPKSYAANFTS
jgi:hypothetical protein